MDEEQPYDLAIIGGGINGVGIASEAALRGLKVYLCEKGDLASATSSASSKLIHGGLRYLEHFAFRLVRESLKEREVLLKKAPHMIYPMNFIVPISKSSPYRPPWMLRLGLFIYDHLGGKTSLQSSRRINFNEDGLAYTLISDYPTGYMYSDCWVDDARLVVTNAIAAREHGATIAPRTECIKAKRTKRQWQITVKNRHETLSIRAKALVNAAGPWVEQLATQRIQQTEPHKLKLIKGSHMVVPKVYNGKEAFLLQNDDGRVIFVIPYLSKFSLIGTTDIPYSGDPSEARMNTEEIHYLCACINRFFNKKTSPGDVLWTYSGVRPLHSDEESNPSKASRDYFLSLESSKSEAPLLTVLGGKLTTYRRLSEQALRKLSPYFKDTLATTSTQSIPLPGGDLPYSDFDTFLDQLKHDYPWLESAIVTRLARAYGTRTYRLLKHAKSLADLGLHFGATLYEAEVTYLIKNEWAITAEDILWRRTKEGIFLSEKQIEALEQWMSKHIVQ